MGPLSAAAEVTGLWKITAYGDPEFTRVGWMLVRPSDEEGRAMPGPDGQELAVTHDLSGFVFAGPGETPDSRVGFTFATANRNGGTFTAYFWRSSIRTPGKRPSSSTSCRRTDGAWRVSTAVRSCGPWRPTNR